MTFSNISLSDKIIMEIISKFKADANEDKYKIR